MRIFWILFLIWISLHSPGKWNISDFSWNELQDTIKNIQSRISEDEPYIFEAGGDIVIEVPEGQASGGL